LFEFLQRSELTFRQLQISSDVENQVNKSASDDDAFKDSQASIRDHEKKEDECQRGDVNPDCQHFFA